MFSASFNKRGLKTETLILDQLLQAQCKNSRNSCVSAKLYNNMEACVTQTYRIILSNLGFKRHPNRYEELAEHKAIWSIALCKRKLNPLKNSLLFITTYTIEVNKKLNSSLQKHQISIHWIQSHHFFSVEFFTSRRTNTSTYQHHGNTKLKKVYI